MKHLRHGILITLLCSCVVVAHGQDAAKYELEKMKLAYEQERAGIDAERDKALSAWPKLYLDLLETVEKKLQAAGEPEPVLAVRKEKERFAKTGTIEDAALVEAPEGLRNAQANARKAGTLIEMSRRKKIAAAANKYLSTLYSMKRDLTTKGNVEDAVAVKEAIQLAETQTAVERAACPAAGGALTLDLGANVTMEFVWVGPGEFLMGSDDSDAEPTTKPRHRVRIDRGFWMGKYEVTQEQWATVMGGNPSHFKGSLNPVEKVSWNDCQAFIRRLNEAKSAGMKPGTLARLPTEAEWEYAAKGGPRGAGFKHSSSDNVDNAAWYGGNSGKRTHPVGGKQANELGLFDMSGNVWEWCADGWNDNHLGAPADGSARPATGAMRVVRGGGWEDPASLCRVTSRTRYGCHGGVKADGFRVVVSQSPR